MADFTALKTAIQNAIKQNGNEEITGNLLQEVLLAIVTTLGDGSINDLVTALGSEATTRQQADGTLQQNINTEAQARTQADTALGGRIDGVVSSIEAINDAIENGYVYAGIATPSSTPTTGKVFYLALTAGTYTNFGNIAVTQGINILKYNGSAWSLDAFVGIDDTPTPSSQKLVKSGGVFDEVMKNGSAFDLSAYNGGATYADLNAALTALNALPAAYKRGGMSMKFVLSSDNKYVQYFLTKDEWSASEADWEKLNLEKEVVDGLGGTIIREGTTENRNLTIGGGFKKGDKIHIELTDGADSKRVTMYKDAYGGGSIGIMMQETYDYDVDADFSAIVFYNDNYAFGYTINITIYRKGQVRDVRELIISDPVVDERTISTSTDLNNVSRFSASVLDGYNDILVKVENKTGVATKWSFYYIYEGYNQLFESTTFGEYIKVTVPSVATKFGIYIFKANVTTNGTIEVSYLFKSYLDKRLSEIQGEIGDIKEEISGAFPSTVTYNGTTQDRSLIINGNYKKGDVLNITIENDTAQSHLFTVYQDRFGGKLIGRPTTLSFQYIAPNDFTAVCFYNDNSYEGYDVTISVEKQGDIKDLQDSVDALEDSVGTIDSVDRLITINENPLSVIRRDAGFAAMFLKWGFIGDSLSSGEHNAYLNGTPEWVDFYEFSWGQFLCRLCGTEGYNFSFGGQTALGWITNTKGDGVTPISDDLKARTWYGAKTNLKDAYTIAFGVNDIKFELSVGDASTDIGVYNPATDTDTNANTFAGHYAGVIQRIKSVQPKAKIFCITMPQGDQAHAEAYSAVIRDMANYFEDVYIIDLYAYAPTTSVDWSYRYRQEYHLNAAGYLWTAYEMMTYIDWIVRNNWRAFNNVAFIGTDYEESL